MKNIEIKNFKCFEDFKAEGFGRVNLIGGKNNVGKTAFIEACLMNTKTKDSLFQSFINVIVSIEFFREHSIDEVLKASDFNQYSKLVGIWLKKYMDIILNSNINNISIKYDNKSELKILLNNNSYGFADFNIVEIQSTVKFLTNFISSSFIDSNHLIYLYDDVKRVRKRKEINKFINNFDYDIIEYEVIDNSPVCFSKKLNNFIDLSEYGNGLKRYVAYVCAIWANKDGYVFIDEVENGIHYSNLDKLWEVILKTSKEANCQVFVTTHSKECIESYARVAKKLEDEEITYTVFSKLKDGSIKAGVRDFELFQNSILQEHEVR
ncbi:MAG TPA: hypothetical protein ENK66_07560 [Arcobacter sp.]|nr:hypothetical protein [Arcobacter sp.]